MYINFDRSNQMSEVTLINKKSKSTTKTKRRHKDKSEVEWNGIKFYDGILQREVPSFDLITNQIHNSPKINRDTIKLSKSPKNHAK